MLCIVISIPLILKCSFKCHLNEYFWKCKYEKDDIQLPKLNTWYDTYLKFITIENKMNKQFTCPTIKSFCIEVDNVNQVMTYMPNILITFINESQYFVARPLSHTLFVALQPFISYTN